MDWNDARILDSVAQDLVLGDFPRGQNRARIQQLANGEPPYTTEEEETNQIAVNVSDLTHTRLMHDARTQYANALLKSGRFATARTDAGAGHDRSRKGAVVTAAWNKYLKRSISYYERIRAECGQIVLHGIAPGVWENEDKWNPRPVSIEDMLIPSETYLGFENLPLFILRRSFTGIELQRLTQKLKRDPGWNLDLTGTVMEWLDSQMVQLRSNTWPEVWSPEKVQERVKQDGGYFMGDQAPKIDVFDIYGYVDDGKESGWVRRMILDSWSEPSISRGAVKMDRKSDTPFGKKKKPTLKPEKNDFLFTSGKRLVARSWQEIASFQFADLSAVFPARYHSVRSLGWMMYASCHLSSRLRCKFYESVLENLMMLFEVKSQDDVQNALKLNLVNRGFIDQSIRPVKAADRWHPDAQLIELGMRDNAQVIQQNSSAWVQNQNYSQDRTEKTRFQVMAELNAVTSLVSSALAQAYTYQGFEFREIFRRFCKPNSNDPDVRAFRAACIRQRVPEKYLTVEAWEIESERVMGAGNKTLEMTIASQLMEWRDKFDPEPQRQILRDAVLAITDDPSKAGVLVPEKPILVTAGTHDAQLTAAGLMAGIPVDVVPGANHIEVIETLLKILAQQIAQGIKSGGMVDPKTLAGLQAIAQHIEGHLEILGQDDTEKPRVKKYGDTLGKLTNQLKAFAQRLQEAAKKQQAAQAGGNGGLDPKDAAKIQATVMTAKTKAQLATESHAQKTAQRAIAWEQKQKQQAEQHRADLLTKGREHQAQIVATDIEAASNIRRNRLTSTDEE